MRKLFLLAPQRFAQPLHHLYRDAALDHVAPEFGNAATRFEGVVDFGETLLPVREEHEAEQREGGVGIGQGLRIGDEVPKFAGGERILARGRIECRLFGRVMQVIPFYSNAGRLRVFVLRQPLSWGIYSEPCAVRAARYALGRSASALTVRCIYLGI